MRGWTGRGRGGAGDDDEHKETDALVSLLVFTGAQKVLTMSTKREFSRFNYLVNHVSRKFQ